MIKHWCRKFSDSCYRWIHKKIGRPICIKSIKLNVVAKCVGYMWTHLSGELAHEIFRISDGFIYENGKKNHVCMGAPFILFFLYFLVVVIVYRLQKCTCLAVTVHKILPGDRRTGYGLINSFQFYLLGCRTLKRLV